MTAFVKIAEEGSLTAAANVPGKSLPSVVRMLLAHVQLQETSGSLSVIANHLGHQSEEAFCRAFKRAFGVPSG